MALLHHVPGRVPPRGGAHLQHRILARALVKAAGKVPVFCGGGHGGVVGDELSGGDVLELDVLGVDN